MKADVDQGHSLRRLLAQARAGSAEALGQLLEEYRPYLLRMANEELDSDIQAKEAASDLVQRSFMEAAQGFERFQGESEDQLRVWLRRVLSNNLHDLRDRYQTQKRQVGQEARQGDASGGVARLDMATGDPSPSEMAVKQELLLALDEALGKLAPEDRELIRLRQQEGKSFVEIGKAWGLSADAVQKRWARAVEELRHLLPEQSGFG